MLPDLTQYNRLKAKALITAKNTGDGKLFALVKKKFDPETAEVVDAEVTGVYLKEVNDAIAEAQAKLDALKAFKAELIAAPMMGA